VQHWLKYFTLPTMWTEQLLGRRRGLCLGLGLSGKVQSSRWSKQGTGARGVVLGWGSVESGSTRSSWHSSTMWYWRGGMKETCVIFWKHDARSTFWQIGGAVCLKEFLVNGGAFVARWLRVYIHKLYNRVVTDILVSIQLG
jgi:hypothetical protein